MQVNESTLVEFFSFFTAAMHLQTQGEPVIHETQNNCRVPGQGYDAFLPLADSGIYIAVWGKEQFLSVIINTCKDFDDKKATLLTREFFEITHSEQQVF